VNPKWPRYQDYVIRDGEFIGEFERMYSDYEDPWGQVEVGQLATFMGAGIQILEKISFSGEPKKNLELGCGLGNYAQRIQEIGFDVLGIDVSPTAIKKARLNHPNVNFEVASIIDYEIIRDYNPDIIVMSQITWYILEDLKEFLSFAKSELSHALILHLLTTYPPGQQKYGLKIFVNQTDILKFFDMVYIEHGEITKLGGSKETFFLGAWSYTLAQNFSVL